MLPLRLVPSKEFPQLGVSDETPALSEITSTAQWRLGLEDGKKLERVGEDVG
jgi:hypothetical protein